MARGREVVSATAGLPAQGATGRKLFEILPTHADRAVRRSAFGVLDPSKRRGRSRDAADTGELLCEAYPGRNPRGFHQDEKCRFRAQRTLKAGRFFFGALEKPLFSRAGDGARTHDNLVGNEVLYH